MADASPRPDPRTLASPAVADEFKQLSPLQREVLRCLEKLDFRAGRERIVLLRWNGTRVIVLDTEQV